MARSRPRGCEAAPDSDDSKIELRAVLLTGGRPRYLHAGVTDGVVIDSEIGLEPFWSPVGKTDATHLVPYLARTADSHGTGPAA